jgi:hypothetical protein
VVSVRLWAPLIVNGVGDGAALGVLLSGVALAIFPKMTLNPAPIGAIAGAVVFPLLLVALGTYRRTELAANGVPAWPVSTDTLALRLGGEHCQGMLLFGEDELRFCCVTSSTTAPAIVDRFMHGIVRRMLMPDRPTQAMVIGNDEVDLHPRSKTWPKASIQRFAEGLTGIYLVIDGRRQDVQFTDRDTRIALIEWCEKRSIAVEGFSKSARTARPPRPGGGSA